MHMVWRDGDWHYGKYIDLPNIAKYDELKNVQKTCSHILKNVLKKQGIKKIFPKIFIIPLEDKCVVMRAAEDGLWCISTLNG